MRNVVWDNNYLLKKASQLERRLPELVRGQRWYAIKSELRISRSRWDGASANAYRKEVEKAVKEHRVDVILSAPNILREAVREMNRREGTLF